MRKVRLLAKRIFRIPVLGIMPQGEHCVVEDPTSEITHGDVVHPCVRYIEEGFEGHNWWMVYTPFLGGDASMENPRLCYSDAKRGEIPVQWKFYCEIAGQPKTGYNSDPTLLFHNGSLYVFFRENYTEAANSAGCSRVTRGCCVSNKQVSFFEESVLFNKPRNKDKEVCPTFISKDDGFWAYTIDVRFCSRIMYVLPPKLSKWTYSFLDLLYDLCIYSRFRSRGVGIWHSSYIDHAFDYKGTVKFRRCRFLYQPWHMDLFNAETNDGTNALFAVVLTNNKQGDICLARCDKGKHFVFYKKPLITDFSYGMKGLYKPSAVVVDGTFMLFYTYLDNVDRTNKLLITIDKWSDVLKRIS